jgi:hypothetical protein
LYTSCILGLRPSSLFNDIFSHLSKKKKVCGAATGAAGDILLMWDKRVVSRVDTVVGDCVAACSFKNVVDGFV